MCFLFLNTQDEVDSSISSSVVLCSFWLTWLCLFLYENNISYKNYENVYQGSGWGILHKLRCSYCGYDFWARKNLFEKWCPEQNSAVPAFTRNGTSFREAASHSEVRNVNPWNINLNIKPSVIVLLELNMKLLWTFTRNFHFQTHRSINYRLCLHPLKCKEDYTVEVIRETQESYHWRPQGVRCLLKHVRFVLR